MTEKVYVIGSNSFTGATFVDYLLSLGCEVMACSRSAEPDPAFLPYKWSRSAPAGGQFHFAKLDLNHDTERIAQAIHDFQPGCVVNFAAQSMVAESWLYPDQCTPPTSSPTSASTKNSANSNSSRNTSTSPLRRSMEAAPAT